jgi:hypothetical protein
MILRVAGLGMCLALAIVSSGRAAHEPPPLAISDDAKTAVQA